MKSLIRQKSLNDYFISYKAYKITLQPSLISLIIIVNENKGVVLEYLSTIVTFNRTSMFYSLYLIHLVVVVYVTYGNCCFSWHKYCEHTI